MFRKELESNLEKIFGLQKTTYDSYSDAYEQDVLFIEIGQGKSKVSGGNIYAKVTGQLIVFSHGNKLPFGFFSKAIDKADPVVTENFFFFDVDIDNVNSPARTLDVFERRASFVYLFKAQFDPNKGELSTFETEG